MNMRTRFTLNHSAALMLGLAAVFLLPAVASAKPKGTTTKCECECYVSAHLAPFVTYNAGGSSCVALERQTCNVEDPATGGIRTGKLDYCSPVSDSNSGHGSSPTGVLTPGGATTGPQPTPRAPVVPVAPPRPH